MFAPISVFWNTLFTQCVSQVIVEKHCWWVTEGQLCLCSPVLLLPLGAPCFPFSHSQGDEVWRVLTSTGETQHGARGLRITVSVCGYLRFAGLRQACAPPSPLVLQCTAILILPWARRIHRDSGTQWALSGSGGSAWCRELRVQRAVWRGQGCCNHTAQSHRHTKRSTPVRRSDPRMRNTKFSPYEIPLSWAKTHWSAYVWALVSTDSLQVRSATPCKHPPYARHVPSLCLSPVRRVDTPFLILGEGVLDQAKARAPDTPFWGAFAWHTPTYEMKYLTPSRIIILGDQMIPQ